MFSRIFQCIEFCSKVQKNILVYNVYRPPSGNVELCIEYLTSVINGEVNLESKEIICLGDLTVNKSLNYTYPYVQPCITFSFNTHHCSYHLT